MKLAPSEFTEDHEPIFSFPKSQNHFSQAIGPGPKSTKLRSLHQDLSQRQAEEKSLNSRLLQMEKAFRPGETHAVSPLLERDQLKKDLSLLSNELIEKNEELRAVEAHYRTLLKENEELGQELERYRLKEPLFDREIAEYKQKLADYRRVKLLLEEGEITKSERVFAMQQKLDLTAANVARVELESIKKEIETNDEFAIDYLSKYLKRLQGMK